MSGFGWRQSFHVRVVIGVCFKNTVLTIRSFKFCFKTQQSVWIKKYSVFKTSTRLLLFYFSIFFWGGSFEVCLSARRLGGWVACWVRAWVGGWLAGCVRGWVGGWLGGWVGEWVEGWVVGWVVRVVVVVGRKLRFLKGWRCC